ncbi:Sensor protein KdpD [Oligella urethralis]|uniref:DUF4118 domain-containing protein n=1 Tax=Oligella urethralis TaxID=90245 RepID=UPI0029584E24|nr:DUF4118 domain-containing protein [Oligella urethralis]WOS38385.1 Sensor protein KdpD [Oligella urethralis]
MTDNRPNPDELLTQIQQDTLSTERGKLKIFFGSSAGVGKTYDMLMAARQAQSQGLNVLVGIVETHGRSETAALLEGLPILPLKTVHYRGQSLKEFDLDRALALRPDILLVDELAHSNVPTSRHPKRWQDVEELINAGINVYTTLNVQHLESVNDVVNQITGIAVRETLPDWFFDTANEVVLVDLPADELLTRLEEGKVYLPNQAKNAVKNFFRKGNLIALRELALRRTAERVDADMRHYRRQARIAPIWNTNDQLLVGLSPKGNNERLIRHAARLAGSLHTKWYVAHVETPRRPSKNKQNILDALRLAEEMGATTQIITANTVAEGLTSYAHQFNIGRIVVGQQRPKLGRWNASLVEQISQQNTKLDIILVNQAHDHSANATDTNAQKSFDIKSLWKKNNAQGYLIALLGCALITASLTKLTQWLHLANVLMLYLLVIVFVSVRFGRLPGIFAVIASVLSFDFFFVEPKYSFSVSDVQYLLTFGILIVVSLLINNLAVGLRFQAQSARVREQQAKSISQLSQGLSASRKSEEVASHATQWLLQHLAHYALIITPDHQNRLDLTGDSTIPPEFDRTVAQWVYDHNQSAGLGTHTLTANKMQYRPLTASGQVQGVLAIMPKDLSYFNQPEQQIFLDVAVSQIALALERIYFVKVAQEAVIKAESEHLRGTLLSALSHDIRTPLAVLSTLAESLLQLTANKAQLYQQHQLALDIQQQSNAIQRLVVNILDYALLQSGGMSVNKQWFSLEELIGGILQQLEFALGNRHIEVHIPENWRFIYTDELLLARVLINLLNNAINYSPKDSPLRIEVEAGNTNRFLIHVIDSGEGVPIEQQEMIFERFTRGNSESTVTGLGLGLALSRDLVKNLEGTLSVRNIAPHGACFTIDLPSPSQLQQEQFEHQLEAQFNQDHGTTL